jgi:DNA mismatch repair protein MutH
MKRNDTNAIEYDKTDPYSIEEYSQKLIGKTFGDVLREDEAVGEPGNSYAESVSSSNYKGGMGNLIEAHFFHYDINSDSRADFPEAGVELKVTPYRINPNGKKVAKERLIITMIDYNAIINETFENSHLWSKGKLMLLIYYLFIKGTKKLNYRIDYSRLFTPPEDDLKIIEHDFEVIAQKVREGKAHELSESDTMYLGAATKSATSANRRPQPNSSILAKPRAFSFKSTYMTYVLNHYIIPGKPEYEKIFDDKASVPFEEQVNQKISKHIGETVSDLCSEYDISYKKAPKNLESMLAFRMLGTKGNGAEEFEKAGIIVKSIRIGKNGKIKEHMSFPQIVFTEIVKEKWEESTFREYLEGTRFFFVVYGTNDSDELYLKGSMFWNVPQEDLEGDIKDVWEETKKVIAEGLNVDASSGRQCTNLPKQADHPVCHVRPHARDAKDTYPLPTGGKFTKQCFWLNNSYILAQIKKNMHI